MPLHTSVYYSKKIVTNGAHQVVDCVCLIFLSAFSPESELLWSDKECNSENQPFGDDKNVCPFNAVLYKK